MVYLATDKQTSSEEVCIAWDEAGQERSLSVSLEDDGYRTSYQGNFCLKLLANNFYLDLKVVFRELFLWQKLSSDIKDRNSFEVNIVSGTINYFGSYLVLVTDLFLDFGGGIYVPVTKVQVHSLNSKNLLPQHFPRYYLDADSAKTELQAWKETVIFQELITDN